MIAPLRYDHEARLVRMLDQTLLPTQEHWLRLETPESVAEAIKNLRVRGAPAIGIAAAYGVVLSLRQGQGARGKPLRLPARSWNRRAPRR